MGTLFPTLVYTLCFATSTLCAYLLGRSFRRTRSRLLFWSALCFALLAGVNFVVVLDMLVFPEINFRLLAITQALLTLSGVPTEERSWLYLLRLLAFLLILGAMWWQNRRGRGAG